jgi:hypothetical protein
MGMTIETLHPDIRKCEGEVFIPQCRCQWTGTGEVEVDADGYCAQHPKKVGRKTISVRDPGKGMGSEPTEGLVDLTYLCEDPTCTHGTPGRHFHGATYGWRIVHFADDCSVCGVSKWWHAMRSPDHELVPLGEAEYDKTRYELYAD